MKSRREVKLREARKPRAINVHLPKNCVLRDSAGPGSIVTMPNGRRYEIGPNGNWIRLDK